jgi:hypothetical protein
MNPPQNKKGKCAGFAPTVMRSDFLAHTDRSTICFGSGAIYSGRRTIVSCVQERFYGVTGEVRPVNANSPRVGVRHAFHPVT